MWAKKIDNFILITEQHLWWLSLVFFATGIFWADQSTDFAYFINDLMGGFIDSYSYIAPIAIYLILTPTLIKLFLSETKGKSFANYTIKWFVIARLIACVYAVIFTTVAFGLPLYSTTDGFMTAINTSFYSLGWMLTHSVYFYAVYASLISVFIALRVPKLAHSLAKGVDLVEYLGKFIVPIIPFLMMAIGAYVTILPEVLESSLGADFANVRVDTVTMLGITIDVSSSLGMILLYVLGALLTGLVCGIWHVGLIILVRRKQPDFSLKEYLGSLGLLGVDNCSKNKLL